MSKFLELRKSLNLKQTVFAKELGVARSTVSMWENGKSFPEKKVIDRMVELYGVSVDYLTGGNSSDLDLFTQRFNVLRSELGLTLNQISNISGVEIEQLENISNGRLIRLPDNITKIASALGTTSEYLITGAIDVKYPENVPTVKTQYFNVASKLQQAGIDLSNQEKIDKLIELARKENL